jgi:surface antigen
VTSYTVVSGDTVDTIAAKFGITAQTIKWANNLTSNTPTVGNILRILPINGILYSVKSDDTIDSIATKYNVDKTRLVVYNDLDVSGLTPNTSIILPDGVLPEKERPGYVAPVYYYSHYAAGFSSNDFVVVNDPDNSNYVPAYIPGVNIFSSITSAGYNGQCTWYAYFRRAAIGRSIPNQALGNAASWAYTLGAIGYTVNSTPSVGAIIQNGGGAGHVGVVERLNGDGSIQISEMNNYAAGGSYVVDLRTVPSYAVGFFNYIH